MASLRTRAPSFVADMSFKLPPNFPTGVLTALTTTACSILHSSPAPSRAGHALLQPRRRLILPKDFPKQATDLTDRRVRLDCTQDRFHQVLLAERGLPKADQGFLDRSAAAPGPKARQFRLLILGPLGVHAKDRCPMLSAIAETVHPDDDFLALLDLPLESVCLLLDGALHVAALDGGNSSPHRLDLLEDVPGPLLEVIRQGLHEVRARQRIDGVGDTRLIGDDLLRPERDALGLLCRDGQRLIEAGEG